MTISSASRSIYTQASVTFGSFLGMRGVPKFYYGHSPIACSVFFSRSREKKKKSTDAPKSDHFVAIAFHLHFSGNPPSVGRGLIFGVSKTLQKVMKITHFDVLRRAFFGATQKLNKKSWHVPLRANNFFA